MRVDFDLSSSLVLQQTISGTGAFDGTEVGRAVLTLGAGNSAVTFKARKLGTDFNGFTVRMVDPQQDNPAEIVKFDPSTNRLEVFLRKAGGVVTSTATQVASAVSSKDVIVTAAYGGTGAGTVAAGSGVLAGAIDPEVARNVLFKFTPIADVSGGRFTFDQTGNILVRQFEAKLGASVAWTLEIITLDEGLREIAAETILYSGATAQTVMLVNVNLVLSPLRALKFSAASTGVARLVCHKEPNFPLA